MCCAGSSSRSLPKSGCASISFIFSSSTEYPASLLANEIQLKCGDKVLRADSVLYSRELQPRMIIEYKAPHIPITQKVFDQISVYNLLLHVDFLVVSNGLEHYICKMDYESKNMYF